MNETNLGSSPEPRWRRVLCLAAVGLWLSFAGPRAQDVAVVPVETLGVEEIERGQQGWGVSVFAGRELERFEVEMLGVMRNTSPGQDYLLARLTGQGLEQSGVIAGMSGSPVYVGDKLVGAVAYSWPFAEEAIAGITPIASMRAMQGSGSNLGTGGLAPTLVELANPTGGLETLERELERWRPALTGGAQSAIGWGLAGFGPQTESMLARALGPLASGGEALPATQPPRLEPGSAVAALLVDGDLKMAATGTVTDRFGDQVLAFGHPFLGLGDIRVPMAEAEVVTVLANQYNSFKIANFGPPIGAILEDRIPGVRGQIGVDAPTTPVTIRFHGAEEQVYRMRLARLPQLTPTLLALSFLGAQNSAARSVGAMGLDLQVRFDLGRHGELELEQSFDGESAAIDAAIYLLTYGSFFSSNSFAALPLEAVEMAVIMHPEPRTAILVGGYAERTEIGPGEEVRVNLDLVPYRGEPTRRQVAVRLPEDLPAGRYSLLVGDGVSLDGARMKIEPAAPIELSQALDIIRGFHSRRDLLVLGVFADQGLSVSGEVLPRLPGSIQSIWAASASRSATPLALVVAQEHAERLELPIAGAVRIDLQVERREPLTSGHGERGSSGSGLEGGSLSDDGAAPSSSTPDTGKGEGS